MNIENIEYEVLGEKIIDFNYEFYSQKHIYLRADNTLYVYIIEYSLETNEIYDTSLEKICIL